MNRSKNQEPRAQRRIRTGTKCQIAAISTELFNLLRGECSPGTGCGNNRQFPIESGANKPHQHAVCLHKKDVEIHPPLLRVGSETLTNSMLEHQLSRPPDRRNAKTLVVSFGRGQERQTLPLQAVASS
jgi:hypothetical protein